MKNSMQGAGEAMAPKHSIYMEHLEECFEDQTSWSTDAHQDQAHVYYLFGDQKNKFSDNILSEEELMIRNKLETEIENALEEEIKHGLQHLALRLRGLYRHKMQARNTCKRGESSKEKVTDVRVITIKMEGEGCKIEMNESKSRTFKSELVNKQGRVNVCNNKHVDWASSVRSGRHSVAAIDQIAKKKRYNPEKPN